VEENCNHARKYVGGREGNGNNFFFFFVNTCSLVFFFFLLEESSCLLSLHSSDQVSMHDDVVIC
jgi:hypothetical protein